MVNTIQASKHNNPSGIAISGTNIVGIPQMPTMKQTNAAMSIPYFQLIVGTFVHLLSYATFDLNVPLLFSINV